ncbi:hypothetical protein D3C87_2190810 [compost metagenome]
MVREHIAGTGMTSLDDAYPNFPMYEFIEEVLVKNTSVTAAAEIYKQQAQAAIDKLGQ